MNPYYTHREYLINELNSLDITKDITILELGTGDGSGEIFHDWCSRFPNIRVIGFEFDNTWLQTVKEKYTLPNYEFHNITDWSTIKTVVQSMGIDNIDLIFVDQETFESRIVSIDVLRGFTDTFILHDYDWYNRIANKNHGNEVVEGTWLYDKFAEDYDIITHFELMPPTLILHAK